MGHNLSIRVVPWGLGWPEFFQSEDDESLKFSSPDGQRGTVLEIQIGQFMDIERIQEYRDPAENWNGRRSVMMVLSTGAGLKGQLTKSHFQHHSFFKIWILVDIFLLQHLQYFPASAVPSYTFILLMLVFEILVIFFL